MPMRLENLGSGMALACAVHCLAVPVLAGAACCAREAPMGGFWVEAGLLGTTGLIGYVTLGLAYRRHRSRLPLALFTTGFALMLLAQFAVRGAAGTATVVAGALIVVAAQWVSRRCAAAGPAPCCPTSELQGESARTPDAPSVSRAG